MADEAQHQHEAVKADEPREGAVETADRGLFDFVTVKKPAAEEGEKKCEEPAAVAAEFGEKVKISEEEKEEQHEEKEKKKEKLHKSSSSSSSSSDEEGKEGKQKEKKNKKKKGFLEKIKDKIPGFRSNAGDDNKDKDKEKDETA